MSQLRRGVKTDAGGRPEPAASPDDIRATGEPDLENLDKPNLHLVFLRLPGGPFPDARVQMEESMECLAKLQSDGPIEHIDLSSASTVQVKAAQAIAAIDAVQNAHLVACGESIGVVQRCAADGIPFFAYFPSGMGRLIEKKIDLRPLVAKHRASKSQIALA